MASLSVFTKLVSFLLLLVRLAKGEGECECGVLCASHLKNDLPTTGYYYSEGSCVQLTTNCSLSHSSCVFDTLTTCQSVCIQCTSPYGCCPNGSSRSKDGRCAGDTSSVSGESVMVHWDVVSIGAVGSILAISLLLIGGLTVYYRRRHGQRRKRRYIHEVLQMYDGSSDSLSDTSVDDNPESNNLFERL